MVLPRRRQGLPILTRRRAYATAQPTTTEDESTTPEADLEYPQVPNVSRQYLPPKGWQENLMRWNEGDAARFGINACSFFFPYPPDSSMNAKNSTRCGPRTFPLMPSSPILIYAPS